MINKQKLTRRELDMLVHIAKGLTNVKIAEALGIATKTVENHIRSMLTKLNANNRTDAVIKALNAGLIDLSNNT